MVAAILPIHSDLFRIRVRSDRTSRSIQRNRHGDLALIAMSTVLRGRLRSGEVIMGVISLRSFAALRLGVKKGSRKGAKSQRSAK